MVNCMTVLEKDRRVERDLEGTQVLLGVYKKILERYPHKEMALSEPIRCEIADDGDNQSWGTDRKGFSLFNNVAIVGIGGKSYVLALADRTMGYAGSEFRGELKFFVSDLETESTDEMVVRQIKRRFYFLGTVCAVGAYGNLIHEGVSVDTNCLVSQKPEKNRDLLDLGILPPPVKTLTRYKIEVVDRLVSGILSPVAYRDSSTS